MQYVVCTGNFFDGMTVYGPFDYYEDADKFCNVMDGDWYIVEIVNPYPDVS